MGLIRPVKDFMAPDASPKSRVRFVSGSRVQMGPSGMVWESSATGLGRTGQPKSQANREALQGLIFGAILNNLGNLEPFLNHFGIVFRHLEQLFDIFEVSVFRRPHGLKNRASRDRSERFFNINLVFFCPFLGSLLTTFRPSFGPPLGVSLGVSW